MLFVLILLGAVIYIIYYAGAIAGWWEGKLLRKGKFKRVLMFGAIGIITWYILLFCFWWVTGEFNK